ncbi:tyrosine-type recombinase/integrase [Candidatus Woesearchaeota archaeon]|nr:tyrosine-type recombinase/integrase [Candidatus Woesearchaeota archaeon]
MLIYKLQQEAQRRGLSPRTIQTYTYCLNQFLRIKRNRELKAITKEEIREYLDRFLGCPNTFNVHLNALKFFFEEVLHKRLTLNVRFSKTPKRVPEFLTKEETVSFLNAITNSKHRLMVELMYGTGMRVSELVNLRIKDFDFEGNYGWIRQGKGGKDRLFILPLKLKEKIKEGIASQKLGSESWLFPGQSGSHYSVSSIQTIVKAAKKRAGIEKNIHSHTLRHSFATHIIQNGHALMELQPLMGHSKLETTMIYLHTASPNLLNVRSPLDSLGIRS